MIFTASVTDFNNALSGATFHPEEDYYGSEGQITISVDDLGNNGIQADGNPVQLTDSKTINIEINNIFDCVCFAILKNPVFHLFTFFLVPSGVIAMTILFSFLMGSILPIKEYIFLIVKKFSSF